MHAGPSVGRPRRPDDDKRRQEVTATAHVDAAPGRKSQVAEAAQHFLRNKRTEWREYRRQVTEFELGRYLPVL